MRIFRNLLLLGAGATLFWAVRHRDKLPQVPHTSFSALLTHASSRLSPMVANAGTDIPFGTSNTETLQGGRLAGDEQIYFSPGQNVERIDIGLINGARSSIEVAMYAFTGRAIARALVRAASRGVQIWIYRDRGQFEQEQARGSQVMAILSGHRNIHVRVKGSDELMHEKMALFDDRVLRDGSGNWSVSAARYQDNQVTVTRDTRQIEDFERDFAEMWKRPGNLVVQ
ncbi:MAG TPA: phospholipase D-like domain-containing protein [Edaphobacter sp.]|uniref:phospholipase D-like domain-containing protein n=1 Tax=Edaphobacter sp. TaxID=1934404 RepID=UPI002C160AD4|nr:phospholipase D-like domain-containing protein [Edaphobacter sp.]HUZ95380.1 phospholipase D-like domain-containing protein [Edaphobacter sp.]